MTRGPNALRLATPSVTHSRPVCECTGQGGAAGARGDGCAGSCAHRCPGLGPTPPSRLWATPIHLLRLSERLVKLTNATTFRRPSPSPILKPGAFCLFPKHDF